MGCDIHAAVEKKVDGKWVMVRRLESLSVAARRNYARFAALAGVRGDGPVPRGIPEDVSDSTKLYISEWGGDGHSHSYYPLVIAAALFAATEDRYEGSDRSCMTYPVSRFFGVDDDSEDLDDYRLVFWFDN